MPVKQIVIRLYVIPHISNPRNLIIYGDNKEKLNIRKVGHSSTDHIFHMPSLACLTEAYFI